VSFYLTETIPTGGALPQAQAVINDSSGAASVALPTSVVTLNGGAAQTARSSLMIPGATNAAAYTEAATITPDGWFPANRASNIPGSLCAFTAIAAGNWTFTFGWSIGTVPFTGGAFQVALRAWQASADRTTSALIPFTGASNGWIFSPTITPGTATTGSSGITANNPGLVTFAGASPFVFLEVYLKETTVGTLATAPFTFTSTTLATPKATYGRASADTTVLTEAGSRAVVLTRKPIETLPTVTDAAGRVASQNRGATDATTLTDAAGRKVALTRGPVDALPTLTDAPSRRVTVGRALTDTAPLGSDAAVRVSAVNRAGNDTAPATDSASRRSVLTRGSSDAALFTSDGAARRVGNGRSSADVAPATDTAARVETLNRSATDSLAASTVTIVKKILLAVVDD
jgi:hypothetical protein